MTFTKGPHWSAFYKVENHTAEQSESFDTWKEAKAFAWTLCRKEKELELCVTCYAMADGLVSHKLDILSLYQDDAEKTEYRELAKLGEHDFPRWDVVDSFKSHHTPPARFVK